MIITLACGFAPRIAAISASFFKISLMTAISKEFLYDNVSSRSSLPRPFVSMKRKGFLTGG
jgi:hypothetical protein